MSPAVDLRPAIAKADEDAFNRFLAAVENQIEADARKGVTRRFRSRDEAVKFVYSLSPPGFRARPEYFDGLLGDAGDAESRNERVLAYARAHSAEVERRMTSFIARIEPLLKQVMANVERQFPEAPRKRSGDR